MELERVIKTLKAQQELLRQRGVTHLSIFGSVARGDNTDQSDIDIAVELDHSMKIGISDFLEIKHFIIKTLGTKVDLVHEPIRFKPRLQAEIDRDRVAAF